MAHWHGQSCKHICKPTLADAQSKGLQKSSAFPAQVTAFQNGFRITTLKKTKINCTSIIGLCRLTITREWKLDKCPTDRYDLTPVANTDGILNRICHGFCKPRHILLGLALEAFRAGQSKHSCVALRRLTSTKHYSLRYVSSNWFHQFSVPPGR